MRAEMINRIMEGTTKVLHEVGSLGWITVVWCHLVKDCIITGLLNICSSTCNQPKRIVVEAASDIGITFLGKWLVLMISTTIFKLCSSDIQDTLSCAVRNQMYESEQILAGISESHTTSDT